MKTGYVYIAALKGPLGPVLRLGISLRHPTLIVARLARGRRRGAPKLIGYEFVEDMGVARAELAAALGGGHTLRAGAGKARAALRRVASRQAEIRRARFHPETGLLVDPDLELSGPVAEFSAQLAGMLAQDAEGDMRKLELFLHPYMVGTIATIFRQKQAATKIPDEYLPEILRDIAWRVWRCRLKPTVFVRMAQRTKREQGYLDLARFSLERASRKRPGRGNQNRGHPNTAQRLSAFASNGQLTAFIQQPKAHLSQTMRGYVKALDEAPAAKLKGVLFRMAQVLAAVGLVFAVDAMLPSLDLGNEPGAWLSALLVVFFAGAAALAFNLYDKPDLTRGLGILTRKEVEAELKAIEGPLSASR